MTMKFQSRLYNIINSKEKLVESLDVEYKQIIKEILTDYQYYIIRAWIKFEKKSVWSATAVFIKHI